MELWVLAFALGATVCWGLSQVIGKIALRNIDTLPFNTVRFSVATLIVVMPLLFLGLIEGIEINLAFISAVMSGFFGWFVATTLFFNVLKRDAAYRVIPTGNAYPFWAILLGTLLLQEPLSSSIPLSASLVFLGTFLLAQRRRGDVGGWRFGVPLASLVAFLWGLNAILNKFALEGGMTNYSLLSVRLVSAVACFWLAFLVRKQSFDFSPRSIGLSALSGVIAFPIGSLLYVSALSFEKASVLAPITGATVLFGFLFSVLLLGERPTKKAVGGMLSILCGILIMSL